jgi:ubiquinone/menaquinone biosynthesis C-methylase UbiE
VTVTPEVYADWRRSVLGAITERVEREAVGGLLAEVPGARLLDAGCGDGTYAMEQTGRGRKVTALDLSLPMLTAGRRRQAGAEGTVDWCQGDVTMLPFADGCFDAVLAVTVLCVIGSPARAVGEMARVLRPGGALVLAELGRRSWWSARRKVRGWLGFETARLTHWTFAELQRLVAGAGLTCTNVRGSVYYPPCGLAARLSAGWDKSLARLGDWGAAFLAVKAIKG